MTYLIMVDGLDRAGKDTLVSELLHRTNYEYLFMVRGIISNIAYAIRYGRPQSHIDGYVDTMKKMQEGLGNKLVTLFVHCDNDVILERIAATNHEPVDVKADTVAFVQAIAIVVREIPEHKIIFVDSTSKTPSQLFDEVQEKLKEEKNV